MCGIAGFFACAPTPVAVADAMHHALQRRGPDAQHKVLLDQQGKHATTSATLYNALLHSRLAIIDPRPVADQPMSNDDASIWICYNGEVYGWEEHKKALIAQGVIFRSHSDTEFILRAYETWGFDKLLECLRGMFAFAILDWRQQKVHLARDRMGEKPLVYSLIDGQFAFGSLVRSVLPFVPKNQRQFLPEAIDAYLAHRYIPAPRTLFQSIQRLENGHCLTFDLQTRFLSKRCYWQPQADSTDWLTRLDESILMRTLSDRPVGVLLSGGVDSTVIASRLALHHQSISSFTATFAQASWDEAPFAIDTAKRLGLPHHLCTMPTNLGADFAQIVTDLDQPFADPSCFPTWYLAKQVSQQVKVVLVGDGGDELLAGYKRVNKHLRTRWRQFFRLPLPITPTLAHKGLAKLATEMAMDWKEAYTLRFSGFTPGQRRSLQANRPLAQLCYWRSPDPHHLTAATTSSRLHDLLALDFANYLPDYILQKSDLCMMAHGLEGRAPLMDHHFYEALLSVPDQERYTQPTKQLFRRALHPALSQEALLQRKKRGFNPPLPDWLKTHMAPRMDHLGERLAQLTDHQLTASTINAFVKSYQEGATSTNEQLLQLLILDESLLQLARLRLSLA